MDVFSSDGLLSGLLKQFLNGVPKVIMAIVILVIGLIIAKIVARIVEKMLLKLQVDKLSDKLAEIDMVQKSNIKIKFSKVLSKFVYYIFALFFLIASTDALGMPAISNLVSDLVNFVPNLLVALIMIIIGLLFAEAVRSVVHTALKSIGIPSANMIATFIFYFLFINIFVSALKQTKIETAFLENNISIIIAGAIAAFAIAYGLAAKDLMSNFLSSFYSKGKLSIGDKVSIGDETGEIVDIDKTTVTIQGTDRRILYPLHKVMNDKFTIHN